MATNEQEFHAADDEVTGVEIVPLQPTDGMVDVQVATAKKYPRSIASFRKTAEELATYDQETAGECLYALKRSGKTIEGPSARFAEILLYAWGNARADAEVVDVGKATLTSQGTFFDLERNVAIRKKVQRRITDSGGKRYGDDMITVTGNAANSIALRNVVFAGVPKALWKTIYLKARQAAIGKAGTMTQTRQKLVEHFGKMGVSAEKLFEYLDVKGIEDVGEDHIILMRGLSNAIRDGETTIEEAFAPERPVRARGKSDINERLQQAAASGASAPPTAAPPAPPASAASAQVSAVESLLNAMQSTKPTGGTASDAQRDELRRFAVKLFEDGSADREKLLELAVDEDLGKQNAGVLIGHCKLAEAEKAKAPQSAPAAAATTPWDDESPDELPFR